MPSNSGLGNESGLPEMLHALDVAPPPLRRALRNAVPPRTVEQCAFLSTRELWRVPGLARAMRRALVHSSVLSTLRDKSESYGIILHGSSSSLDAPAASM